MEKELFIINRDEGTEVIIFDPKSNSAVIRLGREIEFCDEALTTRVREDIESAHPYHATVKKVVSSTATGYWGTIIAELLQAQKISKELARVKKELKTAKDGALNDFNEILFRCAPEMEEVTERYGRGN